MPYKSRSKVEEMPGTETQVRTLPNGLRVVHKFVPFTRIVHCGYIFNAGSRDERPDQAGLAHFIEHMIFKGTEKRRTYHVLNYLESVGGELNAYTTKEKTCLYATVSAEYVDRATELLTDITFQSTFPEREVPKEQQVIAEEIDMYRNAPDEAIFEDFDTMMYPNHPLGWPILGDKETLASFTRADVVNFINRNYTQDRVAFAIVGPITSKQLDRLIERYLAAQTLPTGDLARVAPPEIGSLEHEQNIPTSQAHEILGGQAFPVRDPHYAAFMLVNNMLGGPAMNSRLNLNIRERYGLTYSINSFYSAYTDSGMWGIYYACEPGNLSRIRRLVDRELRDLCEKPLGTMRLHQMKKQLIGQITLNHENFLGQMLGMAKDVLDYGEPMSYEAHIEALEAVTVSDIMEVSNRCFTPDRRSRLSYLPA